jgi:hypothetical protein
MVAKEQWQGKDVLIAVRELIVTLKFSNIFRI